MRLPAVLCLLALGVPAALAQTLEPGTGAPSDGIKAQFQAAFNRGVFPSIASPTPQGTVARFGTTGLRQLFTDSTRSGGGTLALVRASTLTGTDVSNVETYQVLTDMYAYYNSVGVATAGYPTTDTRFCPNSACTWQLFDRRYALFAYTSGANDTQNITTRDPFYTRWDLFGGINTFGPATTAETTVTSSFGSNATFQAYANGILFNITSGALNGRLVSVRQPVYPIYVQRGGATGSLGLPTADVQTLANGRKRQTFEGGSIEYADDGSAPVLRAPVNSVTLRPATTPVRMNAGDTLVVTATVIGTDGLELQDRSVNFTTSNARVVSVLANGLTATVRAAGGGTARIAATSEGKTSLPVDIIVSAVCCAVGEGAPNTAMSQAMNDAVARTGVQLRLPGPERVRRSGSGYVQEFQSVDPVNPISYLIMMSDRSAQAFVVGGTTLARFEELGGTAGALGFAVADATPSGRQDFERGTLAGNPARMVSGAIARRWAQEEYEAGPAGLPLAEAVRGTSFTASAGVSQAFTGGVIVSGPRGAFLVRGVAAEYYLDQDGILSPLGLPVGEEFVSGAVRRQEFEGGTLEYADDAEVKFIARPRTPAISISPGAPLPGSRVRISVSGFPDRSALRISATGQTDFVVSTVNGAHTWEIAVPPSAAAATVTLRALDTATNASVQGAYTIRTLAQARVTLSVVSGDTQTGAPGATLAAPLRVQLRDDRNTPVVGVTVRFTASPGASVNPPAAITDDSGVAETALTLPATDGIALATAEAAGQVRTFSARSAGGAITGFPRLTQSGTEAIGSGTTTVADGGALLTSAAAIIRFLQVRGDLKNPNGMADVSTLNEYLRRACVTDAQGIQICDGFISAPESREQIVNLWRLAGFVGGSLEVSTEKTDLESIRSLVAGGSPVLIALSLTRNDGAAGSHFVVATGVMPDGGLQIHDPRAAFARSTLGDYVTGFDASGAVWKGAITGAVRLLPRAPVSTSFVVVSSAPVRIASATGACGSGFEFPERPARTDGTDAGSGVIRVRACEGTASEYQLEIGSGDAFQATVTDLTDGGSRSELAGSGVGAFRVYRPGTWLAVTPQETVLSASAVLNAATFTPDVAVGGLIAISGNGLARSGEATRVEIGGRSAVVVSATPFVITAQIPQDVAAGNNVLRLESPYGSTEQNVEVRPYAPAVFRTASGRPNIVNATGNQLNSAQNPVTRGQTVVIYATGLGVTSRSGTLNPTATPVTVVVSGQELRPSYAGLAPGFAGLYQINVVIPATFPPGLDQTLKLRQVNVESSPVEISIQ